MQFGQLRRREFLTISSSAAVAWPVAALSQETKVRRIGALILEIADAESFRTELREELRKLGYVEGRNILFEFRSAEEKIDRLPTLAAELVADKVDVIVALYTPCGLAAQPHLSGQSSGNGQGPSSRALHAQNGWHAAPRAQAHSSRCQVWQVKV